MPANPKKRTRRTQAERKEEAEEKIIETGLNLIEEKGYGNFSLRELGIRAGYSRGLPLHHFGSKEAVLRAILERLAQRYSEAMKQAQASERGLPRLLDMIRIYSISSEGHDGRVLSVIFGDSVFDRDVRKMVSFINQGGLKMVRDEIEIGQAIGNIRKEVEPEIYSQMVYAFLRGHMNLAVTCDGYDGTESINRFLDVVKEKLKP